MFRQLKTMFQSARSTAAGTAGKPNNKARLGLEALEDRQLMSVSAMLMPGGILQLTGSGGPDTIDVHNYRGVTQVLDSGRVVYAVGSSLVNKVKIDAGGGNDLVRMVNVPDYSRVADPLYNQLYNRAIPAEIDGGPGNDDLYGGSIAFGFGSADDVLRGGPGHDELFGGSGNDTLYGGVDDDDLYGQGGRDGLFGGAGINLLMGGSQADRILLWASDIVDGVEPQDALIDFNNTTSANVTTTSGIQGTLTYAAASWTEAEIEKVDDGLKFLHELTRNTNLLKTQFGAPISFERYGGYVFRNQADGVNDVNDAVANSFGSLVTAWNLNGGKLAMTNWGMNRSQDAINRIVLHEVGHNWDDESVLWGFWLDHSGWRQQSLGAPGPNEVLSGDGNWYHNKNAQFVRTYSKWNPKEDWATTWEAYYDWKQGTLSAADAARLASKFEFIEVLIETLD